MRRWASFMARHRISWIDQRIKDDASVEGAVALFLALARRWPDDG
jgi:predicted lipid carrier protein YhbT